MEGHEVSPKPNDGPLLAVVFGPKRHALIGDGGLVDTTEANLGGTYVDPPTLPGRVQAIDGYRRWSMAAVQREVWYAQERATDPSALRPEPEWDADQSLPAPVLRRFIVKSPAMADALPASLGARRGTRYVVGEVDELRCRGLSPVALDSGGDLSDWQHLGWADWVTGKRLRVTTDPMADAIVYGDPYAVLLATLDAKGAAWSDLPRSELVASVTVDPQRLRPVGRVSGVLDAFDEGRPGELSDYRPGYRRCACGCGAPLDPGSTSRYVDDDHRRAARNARRRWPETARHCECGCGAALAAGRRDRRFHSDAHRKAAARNRSEKKARGWPTSKLRHVRPPVWLR